MTEATARPRLRAGAAGLLLVLVGAGAVAGLFLSTPPIPQDPAYHDFADRRTVLGIPHAGDVLGNLALVLSGAYGLMAARRASGNRAGGRARSGAWGDARGGLPADEAPAWRVAFLGVLLTGFGSAAYHWHPDSATLLWDRLPMSVTSGAMLSIVVAEFVSARAGRALLVPSVAAGLGSVLWWQLGASHGGGDLRAYGLVQFFPALALVLMLLLGRPRHRRTRGWWTVLAWFAAAKAAEALDRPVYEWTGLVSGHNAKHVFAGVAVWAWARVLLRRTEGGGPEPAGDGTPGD